MKTLKNKTNKRKDNRNENKFNIDKSNHRLNIRTNEKSHFKLL